MQYGECIEWLADRGRSRIEPGLGRTRALLSRLGHRGDEIPGAGWHGSLVLDGAHNPHALRAVIPEAERLLGRPSVAVFAAMRDKALAEMLDLIPRTWPLVVTAVEGERAAVPQALATLCAGHAIAGVADNPAQALGLAARSAAPDRPIIVLGSLYLVGAVRDHLNLPPA